MVGISLFHKQYGPATNPTSKLSWFRIILFKLGLIGTFVGGIYVGVVDRPIPMKIYSNVVEKSTPVKEGLFQSPYEIQTFVDKVEGFRVPSYGTIDKKIPIGKDMYPVDMIAPLKERSRAGMQLSLDSLDLALSSVQNEMERNQIRKEFGKALTERLYEAQKMLKENYQR